ncbi:hypothetical protein [Rhizobium sp. NXC24]|uniref:hypothetical protein n=1 Tax=Rhizobium sp. NXC24 TaxID=2048897 RepID=UPI000CDF4C24|nr:hypothetical protein [Rhizobium sp. NXC24]AVA22789.1 hypothetical protein NXC24_CH03162 [Rhizobium sp. NXC24]
MHTTTKPRPRSQLISPNYTAQNWQDLNLDPDNADEAQWQKAGEIIKDRIEGRFLKPADALIEAEADKTQGTFGFAILALDFLVIETVQGFREGRINHTGQSETLFKNFLKEWSLFKESVSVEAEQEDKARKLYLSGRCALHHSGSTDFLKVGISGTALEFSADGLIRINRTLFHQSLSQEFTSFIEAIETPGDPILRRNVKTKMNEICQK